PSSSVLAWRRSDGYAVATCAAAFGSRAPAFGSGATALGARGGALSSGEPSRSPRDVDLVGAVPPSHPRENLVAHGAHAGALFSRGAGGAANPARPGRRRRLGRSHERAPSRDHAGRRARRRAPRERF